MPSMLHTKAVVVVPSRSVIVHPETLMKTKVCFGAMWSCNTINDGEQPHRTLSWRTDEVHPNQQTVLHFPESPQGQVVQAEAFVDPGGCFFLRAAGAQFWIILNTTKRGGTITAQGCCGRLRWCPPGAECSSAPSGELNSSVKATNYFFGLSWAGREAAEAHEALGVVEMGCRNVQPKVRSSVNVSQPFLQWLYDRGLSDLANEFGRRMSGSASRCGLIFLSSGTAELQRKQPSLIWTVWCNL